MRKKSIMVAVIAATLAGCVVAPSGRGPAVVLAPALPIVVEFDVEPYYYYRGFYYYFEDSRWRYAKSRSGPWYDLPRSHYPREIRYKNRGREGRGDGDRWRDRDDDRRRERDSDRPDPWWERDDDRRGDRDRRRDRDDDR